MVFQQNLLEKAYFIAKMSSPASSDFWKAPLANDFGRGWLAWTLAVADPDRQVRGGPVIHTLRGAVSSALWASFWPKHNGGAGLPGPLPWIRHCLTHWASKLYKLPAQQENLPVPNYLMRLFSSPGMNVRMKWNTQLAFCISPLTNL